MSYEELRSGDKQGKGGTEAKLSKWRKARHKEGSEWSEGEMNQHEVQTEAMGWRKGTEARRNKGRRVDRRTKFKQVEWSEMSKQKKTREPKEAN